MEKLSDFDAIKPLDAWKTEFLVKALLFCGQRDLEIILHIDSQT